MRKYIILLLISSIMISSGCTSLRRKFIRQKKQEEDIQVYVDFKDYGDKPTSEAYVDYFLYVRGWLDELKVSLDSGLSYKRSKRAIDEAIMNMEQITDILNDEGKAGLKPILTQLNDISKAIKDDRSMGYVDRMRLIKEIEKIRREFDRNFSFSKAQVWFVE